MTSEIDNLKTNDILRRRKLRLQQVREQSKTIAKKVRQRTSEEKLRQITKETSQKEQELINVQDKFVKELKEYYIQGIRNVGEGHKQATLAKEQDSLPKEDFSKLRGKAAVAELRKSKQKKLDIQKKKLDRKLQARDVANEISRDKYNAVGGKIGFKTSDKQSSETNTVLPAGGDDVTEPTKDNNDNEIESVNLQSTHCNMATQWETEETLHEWNPTVPTLPLPIDEDPKDTDHAHSSSKKLNLFSLSNDMPDSLRGGLINTSSTYEKIRPSLSLVTEYLQARAMRLREPTSLTNKKPVENLDEIKQTIIRTRSTRNEVADTQTKISEQGVNKKPSVTMYNHSTRDTRDIPYEDSSCVMRDQLSNEDAFTQAMRHKATESTQSNQENNLQTMRSKVAISKVNVEKEYKNTMHFLNTLHKNKAGTPIIKNVYKDDEQLHEANNIHQRKLEREYKKNVKEHKRHTCRKSNQNKSKLNTSQQEVENDFEYSWMPIPESDDNLAIHTIPTTTSKQLKSGNTVKFNKVDGYHEYRSRHKHTPPTKDAGRTKSNRKVVEAVFVEDIESSLANETDTGSAETLTPEPVSKVSIENKYANTSDADRIIIYKIIESKKSKKDRQSTITNEGKRTQTDDVVKEPNYQSSSSNKAEVTKCDAINEVPLENLKEGLYKTVADKGVSYIMNYHRVDTEIWRSNGPKPWWTNVSMLGMNSNIQDGDAITSVAQSDQPAGKSTPLQWEIGNKPPHEMKAAEPCNCGQLSSCTSASSFKTADKVKETNNPDGGGYIKLVNDDGQQTGQFYIGASGILRDDAYEVVLQVRKKDGKKTDTDNAQEKSAGPLVENYAKPVESGFVSQDVRQSPNKQSLPAESTNYIKKTQLQPPNEVKTHDEIRIETDNGYNHNNFAEDKRISKSIQVESFVISNKDPVKSAFTQTSFSSPTERQAYIQMSSSASTSYMSPPEKILPIFMKNRHNKPEYCVRHEICRCRKCALKKPSFNENKNCNEFARKLVTPPNTARSHFGAPDDFGSEHTTTKKKSRCRKAHSQKEKKRKKSVDSRHSLPSNREVWNNLLLQFSSGTTSSQTTGTAKRVLSRNPNLNPLIKTYIDHLLSLNSESLKAIEVVNLQCSSVSTPGSSIIEVPHNAGDQRSKKHIEKNISLEQIKKYIEKQLIEKLQERNYNSINELTKRKSKPDVHRKNNLTILKKKQVHKVKSLNISKTVLKSHNTSLSKNNSNRSCSKTLNSESPTSTIKICHDIKQPQYTKRSNKSKNKREPLKYDHHKQKKSRKLPSPIPSVETMVSGIPMHSEVAISPINTAVKEISPKIPVTTSSAQTNKAIDNDLSFIKIAESKLQNMEKIADLTEKCTNRLSNLAKVLEEVRRNKCTSYPHVSTDDVTSSSDNLIEKNPEIYDGMNHKVTQYSLCEDTDDSKNAFAMGDIRETNQSNSNAHLGENPYLAYLSKAESNSETFEKDPNDQDHVKTRSKPPPALTNFGKYYVTPHELSTVVEVDSPMSLNINTIPSPHMSTEELGKQENKKDIEKSAKNVHSLEYINPDIIQNNSYKNKNNEDSKHPMLDLNQFNKIMLQPFLSIQEYAKDVNVVSVDETSNVEDFTTQQKEGNVVVAPDDVSSLHSDGSLPDVVSELLKRKLIAEPFKFDSPSNNSTTVSSDSSLSILKVKSTKDKRKTHNKKNVAESSDSISISSNPDLEYAFRKLGMGWASSTLKKTKERLALSSSSNTSSSSLSQFKIKTFNQEIPALVTDSISSVTNVSRKKLDKSRNAEQQTFISNSMTVKEFLTTELAKKITFTKKHDRNEQPEEFVSLYETKIPEKFKDNSQAPRDCSLDLSQNGNRARTSTPVQIFKTMTYHSSSNSNTSNGLFSNADDLSSVKGSNSIRNHSTSDKDDLTIPNYSLKMRKSPDDTKSD